VPVARVIIPSHVRAAQLVRVSRVSRVSRVLARRFHGVVVVRARHRLRVSKPFTRVVALARACCFACVARRLRVIINSLSLMNIHVSDINSSSHTS
jgi:hypothetical protein